MTQPKTTNDDFKSLFVSREMLDTVVAEQCKRSFFRFVKELWHEIIPEPPVWNWHIEYLCHVAQSVMDRVFNRQPKEHDIVVINVPPGSTKSTIFSVMLPAWAWTRDQTIRTICGCYAGPLAIDLASRSRDVITSTTYQRLFPDVKIRDDTRGKGHFKNELTGERYATSVGGTVTGMHGHVIVVDDPINPNDAEALSEANMIAANAWLDRTLPSRCIDKSITPTFLVMQRLHENDPTGHILKSARDGQIRVRHICLPAELETEDQQSDGHFKNVQPEELRANYVNGLLDPVRLPADELDRSRVRLGTFGFAGQFDQSPVPLGGGLFKMGGVSKIEILDWNHVVKAIRYWDKAASEGRGCFTVGVLMCQMRDGSFVVADVVRGQWSPLTREEKILQTAQRDGKAVKIWVEQEAGGGGKSDAQATARTLAGYSVTLEKAMTAKELRALPYAAQVEAGNVRLLNRPWNDAWLNEHLHFPNGKYKDQVDASSGAFNNLVGSSGLTW